MDGNRKNATHQFSQPDLPYIGTSKPPGVSLNVHLSVPATTTAAQDGSHTPNTPEILNSIVKLQAEREARESNTAAGPFGVEFARQCAIQSTPMPTVSISNEMDQSVGVPESLNAVSSGYHYMEVIFICAFIIATRKYYIMFQTYFPYLHILYCLCSLQQSTLFLQFRVQMVRQSLLALQWYPQYHLLQQLRALDLEPYNT